MNDRFKFRIAVYERQQNNMLWEFIEYIDPDNQHWGLNQCGDIISDSSYSAHYTRKNAPDSVNRVYEPEQCTGLKDKNGNLIYESDLVRGAENTIGIVKYGKHPRTNSNSMELGFYIEWQMKYPYRSDICYWTSPENKDCIEIISNIHEQAEQKDNK